MYVTVLSLPQPPEACIKVEDNRATLHAAVRVLRQLKVRRWGDACQAYPVQPC